LAAQTAGNTDLAKALGFARTLHLKANPSAPPNGWCKNKNGLEIFLPEFGEIIQH
jgi:hypothetical protein|tara:strand:+ start:270 stop:434 length:165 start_codon:yes stop_codon:yes gene_type:complete